MPNTKIYSINNLLKSAQFLKKMKVLAKSFIIFCDENIEKLYGEQFLKIFKLANLKVLLISFQPGERNKTRKTKEALEDHLLKHKISKDYLFIALGGGVTTDLIGFLAATYLRGVEVVFIPTTLLSMVDASFGGKVGLNTCFGKNLIGTFYYPRFVFIDPVFLDTLPQKELVNGYVEMLKHGLIASKEHFEKVAKSYHAKKMPSLELILTSIQIKQKIVSQDNFDQNVRKILNFGHTFGHAIEILSNFQIPHGKAVGAGILMESYLSMKMGYLSVNDFFRIKKVFENFSLSNIYSFSNFKNALAYDKKNKNDSIEFIVLNEIGKIQKYLSCVTHPLSDQYLMDVIDWSEKKNHASCCN